MTGIRICELAAASGLAATTLRHYGMHGLLRPERDPNGYRRRRRSARALAAEASAAAG